jgi:hypothetical protein
MKSLFGLVASSVIGVALCPGPFIASAQEDNGASEVAPVTSTPKSTNGSVKCTADINSDGRVFACKNCNRANTKHLGTTGTYLVEFKAPCTNITAANGWSRWVEPDTFGTGNLNAYCTTADRGGEDPNAVYVQCQNAGGKVDASFFLFVAK